MPTRDWTDLLHATTAWGVMATEAQMVIAMRLWGMAGLWNLAPSEQRRMISEKTTAALAAQRAATRAALAGGSAGAVLSAAIKPVRRRTRSNVARLSRGGPKF